MDFFEGFSEDALNLLMGIRFNNNKTYFEENKYEYKRLVHQPMVNFSNALYEKIKAAHPDFIDTPRVCRAYRDTRFSKNKQPYKESKWFFLREGNISTIQYTKPNYFFEIKPETYSYGLGFWAEPKVMNLFREYALASPGALQTVIDVYKNQSIFKLQGDTYKKKYMDVFEGDMQDWFISKEFTFFFETPIDDLLFSEGLLKKVYEELMLLYPIYEYFSFVAKNVAIPENMRH